MNKTQIEQKLTPEIISETFELLGLNKPETRLRLKELSDLNDQSSNVTYKMITTDNTQLSKGVKNA